MYESVACLSSMHSGPIYMYTQFDVPFGENPRLDSVTVTREDVMDLKRTLELHTVSTAFRASHSVLQ